MLDWTGANQSLATEHECSLSYLEDASLRDISELVLLYLICRQIYESLLPTCLVTLNMPLRIWGPSRSPTSAIFIPAKRRTRWMS